MIIDIDSHVYPDKIVARAIEAMETVAEPHGVRAVGDGTLKSLKNPMKNNWRAERHKPAATKDNFFEKMVINK